MAMSRRSFVRNGAVAGTLLTAAGCSSPRREQSDLHTPVRQRDLGSTGYRVSEIGFGAMNTRDGELLHAAIDRGINYIDTAYVYMNGQNEEMVGEVMQTRRDDVFLTTKLKLDNGVSQIPALMETSLSRLRVDQVDCVLVHDVADRSIVLDQQNMDAFGALRDKGQTRFIGVSMHSNATEVLDAVIESGLWQIALVGYNYTSPPELTETIARARAAGIGIVAMKNLLTSEWPPSELNDYPEAERAGLTSTQAMIKWVLEDPNIDVTIPGMTAFEHLDENLALMKTPLSFSYRHSPRQYAGGTTRNYCSGVAGCTGCRDRCPNGVAVNEINRCLGYAEGYGDMSLARENYDRLPVSSRVDICGDCDECKVTCLNGLNLTDRITRAKTLFG